jgi:DNA-binding NarL/FixJ family response regulator
MSIEIGRIAQGEMKCVRVSGRRGDVAKLIAHVAEVISAELRSDDVKHRCGQLLAVADWRGQAITTPEALTTRERDVLGLMTNGLSNTQIAEALDLGEGAVRNHVSSILSKLGVSDRTKAVLRALQQRLV